MYQYWPYNGLYRNIPQMYNGPVYWGPIQPQFFPTAAQPYPQQFQRQEAEAERETEDTSALVESVGKAVNGQYNAIRIYERLAELAPNSDFRRIVLSIRDDEKHHFEKFSGIYSELTGGNKPTLEKKPLPDNFAEGVEASIRDELKDSKFYQGISELTTDSKIHMTFMHASFDEARHATWFSYIWNKERPPVRHRKS